MKGLAVIVVSFNTKDLLRGCLRSIFASALDGIELIVVVVDNASRDGSADMVREHFPQVRLLEPGQNLGFTAANNLALHALGIPIPESTNQPINQSAAPASPPPPTHILLLNPDTQLPPATLAQMVRFLDATPGAGACGAGLRFGDGRFQHGAFRFPTLAQVIIDLLPVHRLPGGHRLLDSRLNGRYPRRLWEAGDPFVVDFVLGAALLVRAQAVAQVGGLDEGFFMYCEEMDWCLRLGQAGWPIYALPTAQVIHFEGQSSKQTPWVSLARLWRSRLRFYAKHPDRYGPIHNGLLRLILRGWLGGRRLAAQHRFARGRSTQEELIAELAAYAAVGSELR